MNFRMLPVLLAVVALAGCAGPDPWPPIGLSEADRAAAEQRLYPRASIMQEDRVDIPEALATRIGDALDRLVAGIEERPRIDFIITREPDPDAGCLAGGRIFVSQGMLAWLEHPDELAGLLALALTACGQASEIWRNRDRRGLVELRYDDWLMLRYRDYRLEAIAPEYNQVVAIGCGDRTNCPRQAVRLLEEAGLGGEGLGRLGLRVREALPDAAWLVRFPGLPQAGGEAPEPEAGFGELLAGFHELREGMIALGDVWRELHGGSLRNAYRDQIRARQALGTVRDVLMSQVQVDLINVHPEYSQREMERLESRYGRHPHRDYWWGMINVYLGSTATGAEQLERSLEVLPRASAHYMLGVLMEFRERSEEAAGHFRAVLAAGPIHPRASEAFVRLAALEEG